MRVNKLIGMLLAAAMAVTLTAGCGGANTTESKAEKAEAQNQAQAEAQNQTQAEAQNQAQDDPVQTTAIYIYLCGSNLESKSSAGTSDLMEIADVKLPEGVSVVIETGGSTKWQNSVVDSTKLQRYMKDSKGLYLLEEKPWTIWAQLRSLRTFYSTV